MEKKAKSKRKNVKTAGLAVQTHVKAGGFRGP